MNNQINHLELKNVKIVNVLNDITIKSWYFSCDGLNLFLQGYLINCCTCAGAVK
jgi:hypothetical protein